MTLINAGHSVENTCWERMPRLKYKMWIVAFAFNYPVVDWVLVYRYTHRYFILAILFPIEPNQWGCNGMQTHYIVMTLLWRESASTNRFPLKGTVMRSHDVPLLLQWTCFEHDSRVEMSWPTFDVTVTPISLWYRFLHITCIRPYSAWFSICFFTLILLTRWFLLLLTKIYPYTAHPITHAHMHVVLLCFVLFWLSYKLSFD